MCYEMGIEGEAEKDYDKALQLYEKSAKMEFLPAMMRLANLLFKIGKEEKFLNGVEVDQQEYFHQCQNWLRMVLHKSEYNGEACYLMGQLYLEGYSVDQNFEYAFNYFEKARISEYYKAYTALGNIYFQGIASRPNYLQEKVTVFSLLSKQFEVKQNKSLAF